MPPPNPIHVLAFGAHPDDLEFGCGGIVALETQQGRSVHFIIGSRGESAGAGTPELRATEAQQAAAILGASLEFIDLGGDAHFRPSLENEIKIATLIRQHRPAVMLCPTPAGNQHPDHLVLGQMVRTACRLARYAGFAELKSLPPHEIYALFFYTITAEAELPEPPVLVDVSPVLPTWTAAMSAHASQGAMRNYVELQLTRARVFGLRAGVSHAQPLWSAEPILVSSLTAIGKTARRF